MNETKPWYQSKTIIGGAVTLAATVAAIFGVEVDEQTQAVIVDQGVAIGTAVATVIGGVLAIYGRLKASKGIGK